MNHCASSGRSGVLRRAQSSPHGVGFAHEVVVQDVVGIVVVKVFIQSGDDVGVHVQPGSCGKPGEKNVTQMGAALFRSPSSSSNSEANTDEGRWIPAACSSKQREASDPGHRHSVLGRGARNDKLTGGGRLLQVLQVVVIVVEENPKLPLLIEPRLGFHLAIRNNSISKNFGGYFQLLWRRSKCAAENLHLYGGKQDMLRCFLICGQRVLLTSVDDSHYGEMPTELYKEYDLTQGSQEVSCFLLSTIGLAVAVIAVIRVIVMIAGVVAIVRVVVILLPVMTVGIFALLEMSQITADIHLSHLLQQQWPSFHSLLHLFDFLLVFLPPLNVLFPVETDQLWASVK
ncbi:unnamed protein product [Menidia menidia]|uniref:(Atlantic silverside) hypothetical protein n=1 Tax=Menidia menidia TaxID=238744 RepID=A0A8S4BB37_9TELE|nr:unnamed protein product [Menidia menidia]